MYQKINLKEVARFARIRLEHNKLIYEADLNPDASEPIQGVEFGNEWEFGRADVASKVVGATDSFSPFTDIIGKTNLRDGMTPEQAFEWLGIYEYPIVVCDNPAMTATAFLNLPDGTYVFYFDK